MESINIPTADILNWWKQLALPPKIRHHLEIKDILADPGANELRVFAKARGPFGLPVAIHAAIKLAYPTTGVIEITLTQADIEGISAKDLITKALVPIFTGLTEVAPHTFHYPLPALPKAMIPRGFQMLENPNAVEFLFDVDMSAFTLPSPGFNAMPAAPAAPEEPANAAP